GLGEIEGKEGWHGKALDRERADRVVAQLKKELTGADKGWEPNLPPASPGRETMPESNAGTADSPYQVGGKATATRKGFADGLVVVVDGDVKNSTYTEEFEKVAPGRFVEGYIAEQNMVGMAMGLAARGRVAFASTFACFFTRAYDFVRMSAISNLNIKLVGT